MATFPNYVVVPCVLTPAHVATNVINAAGVFRAPNPQPAPAGASSSSAATGPQLWPLKL